MPDLYSYDGCALLAMCVYGEARGESIEGQIAVANVVKNRVFSNVQWWGNSYKSVILKKWQFSCFLDDDPNLPKMLEAWENKHINKGMKLAAWISCGIIDGHIPDNTKGATHYHYSGMATPRWALGQIPLCRIGDHTFYRILN